MCDPLNPLIEHFRERFGESDEELSSAGAQEPTNPTEPTGTNWRRVARWTWCQVNGSLSPDKWIIDKMARRGYNTERDDDSFGSDSYNRRTCYLPYSKV